MADLVVFPHLDLHVVRNAAPPLTLTLRVCFRDLNADGMSYSLTDVTSQCSFDLFAPYNAVGSRLAQFVTIDPATGRVTPQNLGINLLQIRHNLFHTVARIQVHDTMLGWWFGNASMTTALDATIAHAQPSVYALFSDDAAAGTDRVGDITGHGYVPLTSNDAGRFVVASPDGRLRGVSEGAGTLSGTLAGVTHTMPVTVVNYGKQRDSLDVAVQAPNVADAANVHNMVFLAEGFRDTPGDREKFDKVVTKVVDEMFTKPRHAPYNLLRASFNCWKQYQPSTQHAVTCAFQVNDQPAGAIAEGTPIPFEVPASADTSKYTVDLLTSKVGLPLRNEARTAAQLTALWSSQSLPDFDPAKVDEALVTAWKGQRSGGFFEARDTFFGLHLGARWADPRFLRLNVVQPPAADNGSDALKAFIAVLYEWFSLQPSRSLTPDPRRHPPELQGLNSTDAGNSIIRFLGGLRASMAPHPPIGQQWVPDPLDQNFKKSRGFVAIIVNEGLIGGTNFNNSTMTANTLAEGTALSFALNEAGNERVMRRTLPDSIDEEVDQVIDTVAHEFGHSFNLDDEYETAPGNDPNARFVADRVYDNAARLGAIFLNGVVANGEVTFGDDQIRPDRVKWFELLRVMRASVLLKDSEVEGGSLKVTIDKREVPGWVDAMKKNLTVYVRKPHFSARGQQLPMQTGSTEYVTELLIQGFDLGAGTLLLGGPSLPPAPAFPKGSFIFIPKRNEAGGLLPVVEEKVVQKLNATHAPLNADPDTSKVNSDADTPVDIAGFKPPCKSYKLIGIYQGAGSYAGRNYRPAGLCKMRKKGDEGTGDGEFCHVCKYLIVQRVDPGLLGILDANHYPTAKKNG